jgi:hypothetical protein
MYGRLPQHSHEHIKGLRQGSRHHSVSLLDLPGAVDHLGQDQRQQQIVVLPLRQETHETTTSHGSMAWFLKPISAQQIKKREAASFTTATQMASDLTQT